MERIRPVSPEGAPFLKIDSSENQESKERGPRRRLRVAALVLMAVMMGCFLTSLFLDSRQTITFFLSGCGVGCCIALVVLTFCAKRERDVTECELVKMNKVLLHYAYIHSHELRAPLARILGLLYVSRMSPDSIDYEWLLERIEYEASELDRVLALFRAELNRMEDGL
jgi:hypothetical protein